MLRPAQVLGVALSPVLGAGPCTLFFREIAGGMPTLLNNDAKELLLAEPQIITRG